MTEIDLIIPFIFLIAPTASGSGTGNGGVTSSGDWAGGFLPGA